MPLTIDEQKRLLKTLKVSDEDIAKAMGEGENTVELPKDLKIYSPDEFKTAKENIEREAKEEGRDEGRDFAMKDLKKHFGIDKDGKKLETVADYIKEKVMEESGKTPQAWEAEKKEILSKLSEKDKLIAEKETTLKKQSFSNRLLQSLPADRNTDLSNEDYLLLLSNKMEIKEESGKEVVYYNGKKLQNEQFEPVDFSTAIGEIWKQNPAWGKQSTKEDPDVHGNGGDDSKRKPGFYNNTKEVSEAMKAKNINPLSKEGREFLEAAQKGNPKFDASVV